MTDPGARGGGVGRSRGRRPVPGVAGVGRSRPFLLLAAAFALSSSALYAVVVARVPLLLERGYTTGQAARVLGGGGGQTLGRTLYAALARRTAPAARTTVLIALGGLTTAAFAVAPGPYALPVGVSVAADMVPGNLTLLQATAITDRWGTAHYGRLSGLLAAPAATAAPLAPFAGAALAGPLGGYGPLLLLTTVSVAAALIAPWTATGATSRRSGRRPRGRRPPPVAPPSDHGAASVALAGERADVPAVPRRHRAVSTLPRPRHPGVSRPAGTPHGERLHRHRARRPPVRPVRRSPRPPGTRCVPACPGSASRGTSATARRRANMGFR